MHMQRLVFNVTESEDLALRLNARYISELSRVGGTVKVRDKICILVSWKLIRMYGPLFMPPTRLHQRSASHGCP
ncbi:hypothetical protein CPC08DRAFT_715607, partial [Agrocybe pediades]